MTITCLIRFVQVHESFRKPELEAIASVIGISDALEIIFYSDDSPFGIIKLPSEQAARQLISRSILSFGIYELWGTGESYAALHASIKSNSAIQWTKHRQQSFRFTIDSFQGKKTRSDQRTLIESFRWFDFEGEIKMRDADLEICIFEDYKLDLYPSAEKVQTPHTLHLGRWIAKSGRDAITTYNLKKRKYISRTSMDAELALVTANQVLAAPGKLVYDPFVGTGSFTVACAHFGGCVLGSDIDGRSIRGPQQHEGDSNLFSNFEQYRIVDNFIDSFIADLTHTPLRVNTRFLDAIVCDPPYGVREGPKVLGYREGKKAELTLIDGVPAYLREGFIAPKRPYGFDDMLHDVLDFSFDTLVDGGRLSMWMPTANDDDVELAIPKHDGLDLVSVSVQHFNKWARRLLTYRRVPGLKSEIRQKQPREAAAGVQANDLNPFRKKYFEGFRNPDEAS